MLIDVTNLFLKEWAKKQRVGEQLSEIDMQSKDVRSKVGSEIGSANSRRLRIIISIGNKWGNKTTECMHYHFNATYRSYRSS